MRSFKKPSVVIREQSQDRVRQLTQSFVHNQLSAAKVVFLDEDPKTNEWLGQFNRTVKYGGTGELIVTYDKDRLAAALLEGNLPADVKLEVIGGYHSSEALKEVCKQENKKPIRTASVYLQSQLVFDTNMELIGSWDNKLVG